MNHEPPCEPLDELRSEQRATATKVATLAANLGLTQQQVGEMLMGIGEAAEHARNSARDSAAARTAAERVAAHVFGPVNERIAQYTSSYPPLDYGDEAGSKTGTQDVRTIIRRAHNAERQRIYLALIAAAVSISGSLLTYLSMRH